MTIIGIVLGLILWGVILSVAGFILSVIVMLLVGGWQAAQALKNRLLHGTWDRPAPTPPGIQSFD